jgi:hypothetical protein
MVSRSYQLPNAYRVVTRTLAAAFDMYCQRPCLGNFHRRGTILWQDKSS